MKNNLQIFNPFVNIIADEEYKSKQISNKNYYHDGQSLISSPCRYIPHRISLSLPKAQGLGVFKSRVYRPNINKLCRYEPSITNKVLSWVSYGRPP